MKQIHLLAVLMLTGTALAAPPLSDSAKKGKAVVDKVCAACHGAAGNNNIEMYPRLAGQHPAYTTAQTQAIKEGKRTTGSAAAMAAMVQSLSESDIRNASAFYAAQQPQPGKANPKHDPELGKKIFRAGLPNAKIPACMSCHGPSGAGTPGGGTEVSAYPRLAGQHASYVADQLKAYAEGKRTSPNGMMEDIAKRMKEDEMKAVGNYIQGLK